MNNIKQYAKKSLRRATLKAIWLLPVLAMQCSTARPQQKPAPELLWNMQQLQKAPEYTWVRTDSLVASLTYSSIEYDGKPTRVFAYYSNPDIIAGRPASGRKFPGVVLIHGGGGRAFPQWVAKWARKGYAAIAMDLAGKDGYGRRLPQGGPDQSNENKIMNFSSKNIRKAWPYHAVGSVILAHSLLLGMEEVDKDRTCVTGISWGGYLTCIVAGLDSRYKAAVPVYGCGFLELSDIFKRQLARLSPSEQKIWLQYYDPSQYMGMARMPVMFLDGNKDKHYNVMPYQRTYSLVPEKQRFICIKPDMKHNHPAGWENIEIEMFFDKVWTGRSDLPEVAGVSTDNGMVQVKYNSAAPLVRARLYYSNDTVSLNENRRWDSVNARIDAGKQLVTVPIPAEGYRYAFVQLVAANQATASTEYLLDGLPEGAAASTPSYYPPFSWDKVPVMAHFGKRKSALTDEEIRYLTKHFPWVVLEKAHALDSYGSTEKAIPADARRIKAVNPATKVLYYWNASINFNSMYDVVKEFDKHPDWALKDKKGNIVLAHENTRKRYDHSNPDLRQWWVSAGARVVNDPAIDGVFIDALPQIAMHRKANIELVGRAKQDAREAGVMESLKALRQQTPGKLLLFNGLRGKKDLWADMGTRYLAYTDAGMVEHFTSITATDKETIAGNIEVIQQAAKMGKIVVVKGFPEFTFLDKEMMKKPYAELERLAQEQLIFPLAAYLVAAGENCWFCYNWGYRDDGGTFSWYPEFDKPLGKPIGDAVRSGWTYTREFEHCRVKVNIETREAQIDWLN